MKERLRVVSFMLSCSNPQNVLDEHYHGILPL